MTLKEQITGDLQDAMRSGDNLRKETLRILRSSIKNAEMARSSHILDLATLNDAEIKSQKLTPSELNAYNEVKRRRQIAEEYEAAGNMEAASTERGTIGQLLDTYSQLDEAGIEDVIRKEVKQRRESIEAFEKAKRMDLADKERAEAAILEAYLPTQMTEDQIEAEVRAIKAETGANEVKTLMPAAMSRMKGKAEGRLINKVVTRILAEG
jgi:hypothetical protein